MPTVTVSSGVTYDVSSGQTDTNDIVVAGGVMNVLSGAEDNFTTVRSGGLLTISAGATIDGGPQAVSGTAFDDSQLMAAGVVAASTPIGGGQQAGSVATGTAVQDDGSQYVQGAGAAVSATLATQVVSGGLTLGSTAFEEQIITAGGNASGGLADGEQTVGSGGTASGTIVFGAGS